MFVKMISVTYSRKFNLGNYESLELAESIWADLEPGTDPEQTAQQLHNAAREHVREEFARIALSLKTKKRRK
jgi:hypothetical protein